MSGKVFEGTMGRCLHVSGVSGWGFEICFVILLFRVG